MTFRSGVMPTSSRKTIPLPMKGNKHYAPRIAQCFRELSSTMQSRSRFHNMNVRQKQRITGPRLRVPDRAQLLLLPGGLTISPRITPDRGLLTSSVRPGESLRTVSGTRWLEIRKNDYSGNAL